MASEIHYDQCQICVMKCGIAVEVEDNPRRLPRSHDALARRRVRVVEINTTDAATLEIEPNARVRVRSRVGVVDAIANLTDKLRPGVVCMDQGFGSRLFDPADGGETSIVGLNRNRLVANDDLDPLSALPRSNDTPVQFEAA